MLMARYGKYVGCRHGGRASDGGTKRLSSMSPMLMRKREMNGVGQLDPVSHWQMQFQEGLKSFCYLEFPIDIAKQRTR